MELLGIRHISYSVLRHVKQIPKNQFRQLHKKATHAMVVVKLLNSNTH
jgi:hypothetical protein